MAFARTCQTNSRSSMLRFSRPVQFIFEGNDSEGLQYGSILTAEKYFLRWKEDEEDNSRFKLDKYLLKMCRKYRLIELIHDFVLFDGGTKNLSRVQQYFWYQGSPGACASERGRHHLAHSRQRQKHCDGVAG